MALSTLGSGAFSVSIWALRHLTSLSRFLGSTLTRWTECGDALSNIFEDRSDCETIGSRTIRTDHLMMLRLVPPSEIPSFLCRGRPTLSFSRSLLPSALQRHHNLTLRSITSLLQRIGDGAESLRYVSTSVTGSLVRIGNYSNGPRERSPTGPN